MPSAFLKRLQILPVDVTATEIIFATSDPMNLDWIAEIERATKKEVRIVIANPLKIRMTLDEIMVLQTALRSSDSKRSKDQMELIRSGKIQELDRLLERNKSQNAGKMNDAIVQILEWLLTFAEAERASDIHLEPKRGLCNIRFRVDGVLRTVYRMDIDSMNSVIARVKVLGNLKLDEKRKPQDGQIKYYLQNGNRIEMRLSTVPCQFGEKLVIRIFDKAATGKDLSFIGFTEEDQATWNRLIHMNNGIVLVTGPTGSGKTTTLYTSLNTIATPEVNVCTVEDPIEMTEDNFNQVQVNPLTNLGFSECIRAFLRQDPDVIMVGEIRDSDTGMAALQASLTGHLVFSSLHTNGALPTIQRLLDIGLPLYLLNSSLRGILAQRLVRRLCDHCKEEYEMTPHEWQSLVLDNPVKQPKTAFRAVGCDECKDTGFQGRFCVYELVEFTLEFIKVLHPKIEVAELIEKTKGMFKPIRVNAAERVTAGETSVEEALKVVF